MVAKDNQNHLRGDGTIRSRTINAKNLAEATHKAILACHKYGARVETPKHTPGMTLGYDADINVSVLHPDSEPKIYNPGMSDSATGLMQYILEVTHGIHNHWKKDADNPTFWGYTYNERFVQQIPHILARIRHDWQEKGRITGRDYNFGIWRGEEDSIIEQEDPPCWQRGNFRFLPNSEGEIVMNYFTDWRSRDLLKAWNQNNIAQVELMGLFAAKVSDMLGVPINLGRYTDGSNSLHLYGLYVDRDNLEQQIVQMKRDGWKVQSTSLDDFMGTYCDFESPWVDWDRTKLKRFIAAQSAAETAGHGKQQPRSLLKKLGYDVETFSYPEEWDTWPKSWDVEV